MESPAEVNEEVMRLKAMKDFKARSMKKNSRQDLSLGARFYLKAKCGVHILFETNVTR